MNNETLFVSRPAYDVYERWPRAEFEHEVQRNVTAIDITVEDTLGLDRGAYFSRFSPGSVVRYAQQHGECPIKNVERAQRLGHKLWWLNQNATCLSSHAREQEKVILIRVGDIVRFEGRYFEIVREPNGNLGLKQVDLKEVGA